MTKDMFKEEKLLVVEYIPFELIEDELYREVSKGSRVSLVENSGILVEKTLKRM